MYIFCHPIAMCAENVFYFISYDNRIVLKVVAFG